jgi:hypothetical protein
VANNIAGLFSQLQIQVSAAYVAIGSVKSISGPGIKQGTREVSSLASATKYYYATNTDNGEWTFQVNFNATEHTYIYSLLVPTGSPLVAQTNQNFKVLLSDNTSFTFAGVVTSFDLGGITEDATVSATLKIKVSGPLTLGTS